MSLAGGFHWSQQFNKSDGTPYSGVRVLHYEPATTTDKAVYTDEARTTAAAQPVVGDSNGRVSFYGDGNYRLLVRSSIADGDLLLYDYDPIRLEARPATLRAESQSTSYPSATAANRGHIHAKVTAGGDVSEVAINKDGTGWSPFTLQTDALTGMQSLAKGADLASAATLTLGTDGNFFDVTGAVTITAISSKASGTIIGLQFDGSLTLTYNATSVILPGSTSITTQAGDIAFFQSEGSGNWRCVSYLPRNGRNIFERQGIDIASAATTDLATATGQYVRVAGTTGITAFGTMPAGVIRIIHFANALTIAHNATTLILPGAAEVVTSAAGDDVAAFVSLGSGNWRCLWFSKIATQRDQEIGVTKAAIVTAGRQHFHPSAAKGWVTTAGAGTPIISESYNVTSVTDNGVGNLTINWATDFSNTTHCDVAMVWSQGAAPPQTVEFDADTAKAAGTTTLECFDNTNAIRDPNGYFCVAFGDHA